MSESLHGFLKRDLPKLRGVLSRFFYELKIPTEKANEFITVMVDALKLKIMEKTSENAGN